MYSERDFSSAGPTSNTSAVLSASSKYMRNSGIPAAHFQVQFKPDSTEHVFGAGVDYKTLKPELYTTVGTKNYKSDQTIASMSAIAYAKFKCKPVTFTIEGVYAQNAYDMVMLGGYTIDTVEVSTGKKVFTNLNTGSVWTDIQTNGKKVQFGLFAGYTMNLGAADSIKTASFYSRGSNIDNIYRVAPRVVFIAGKLNVAIEIEHTVATYGKANGDSKGGVTDGKAIANTRALLAVIYKF
jgi:hypothetical protein